MAELAYAFMRSHPAEAARVIEGVAPSEAAALFAAAPVRLGAAVLAAMLPAAAARVVDALEDERAMALLAALRAQAAVLVLRHIEEPRRGRLIAGLPTASALASRLLLGYPEDSVGAWADPHVLAFSGETRAAAAFERVRGAEGSAERLFVVAAGQRLAGWLTLERLLRAPEGSPLDALISRTDAVLAAHTPLSGALHHPGWLEHSVLPVVEADGRLLGLLTSDALARALGRSAPRAAPDEPQSLAGVLAAGGWTAVSGMVEAAVLLLPSVPPIGRSHER